MRNNVLGLSGSLFAFESKAEALKWAIEFTAGWKSPDERLVRYEQAQELYDFICRNVQLPDTKNASMDDFLSSASGSLVSLKEKLAAMKTEAPLTPDECFNDAPNCGEHSPEPCCEIGKPDVIGAPDEPCCKDA